MGCVESRDTHSTPSWREYAVISRPEGKANKDMSDMWVGKNSMRKKVKEHLFFILSHITRSPKVNQIANVGNCPQW